MQKVKYAKIMMRIGIFALLTVTVAGSVTAQTSGNGSTSKKGKFQYEQQ